MIRKILPLTASLTLALALGACGGGTDTDTGDGTVVDPAAPVEPVESAAGEALESTEEATEGAVAAVEEAASDGWMAMQGDWENSAGLVKDRWAELTEEEILGTGGDRDQLVVLVQEKYGIEREQAEQEVNDWASTL